MNCELRKAGTKTIKILEFLQCTQGSTFSKHKTTISKYSEQKGHENLKMFDIG